MLNTAREHAVLVKVFETPDHGDHFAGYYDKSPLDATGTRLLALRAPFINRMPIAGEGVEIGYFDFPCGREFKRLASTVAWNWQQGCMLQWLGPDFQNSILYNDLREERYRAIQLDLRSGEERVLPMPAYVVSSDGAFALGVDYERLYWYRPGYNYQGPPRSDKRTPLDPKDGIWHMSLEQGETKRIISMADVLNLGLADSMQGADHWLEHLMINPGNSRFAFIHRWRSGDGGIAARLITSDVDGRNLFVLNDSGRVSHYCWRDDTTLFGYCGSPTMFNKLRARRAIARALVKPLLPLYHRLFPNGGLVSRAVTGDCFQLMKDRSKSYSQIDRAILREDGHPSFRPGQPAIIVNDTYPNERGECLLQLCDVDRKLLLFTEVVASDPRVRATGYRCDLHPKWSFDGRHVAIDTLTSRGRSVVVYQFAASGVIES